MILFSAWNVGETLGVFDQRRSRGFLSTSEFSAALANFADETLRMIRQGSLSLSPLAASVLSESWRIVLEEHLYAADALQIASSKQAGCDVFLSADKNLLERARSQGLNGMDPERDEKKLKLL